MAKICMVTSIHPDYDARIYKMANNIAQNGHEIDLICPWNVNPGLLNGINYLPFPKTGKRSQRYKNYYHIWKLIHRKEYDIYHFHDLDLVPFFILFKMLKHKHIIYDMHENYPEEMLAKQYLPSYLKSTIAFSVRVLEWIGIRLFKHMVVVEDGQAQRYGGRKINSILVRNFASGTLVTNRSTDYVQRAAAVIFTGSQYESNGSLLMLDIARIVCREKPETVFYCIDRFSGNESLREEMFRRIDEYGIKDNIKFLPNVKPQEVMGHLNLARVALAPTLDLPRHRKAIPNKLFEYMAAGLPIVASNLPYNKGFVEDGGCGFVANPSQPEDFAEKVLRLLDDSKLGYEMGQKGIHNFETMFNWEIEMKKLLRFYAHLT